MKSHITGFYKDGHKNVEFCKVCGAEGELLLVDCPGQCEKDVRQSDFFDKELDKGKEQF